MNNAGLFANAALLLWIPLAIGLFFAMRPEKAALITIFGGLMFLPEVISFRIPFVPPLGKQSQARTIRFSTTRPTGGGNTQSGGRALVSSLTRRAASA